MAQSTQFPTLTTPEATVKFKLSQFETVVTLFTAAQNTVVLRQSDM